MHRRPTDFLITAFLLGSGSACTLYGPSLLVTNSLDPGDASTGTDACSEACATPEPTCTDHLRNGSETDVDCGGGGCPVCGPGQGCAVSDRDCGQYNMCSKDNKCIGVSCADALKNAHETDVDCGGGECPGCAVGQICTMSTDCDKALCDNGHCVFASTCAQIHAKNPNASDGVYQIDVDGVTGKIAPFPVYCDMTTANGGWTRVGFEPAGAAGNGIQGDLAYLGVEVGDPAMIALQRGAGLFGSRFSGKYTELAVIWGKEYIRMTVARDIFVNEVDLSIPVSNFVTSNTTMKAWVTQAGGAFFCRASRSLTERPGDTSWAVKPTDTVGVACGCDGANSGDHGVFYGGGVPRTSCNTSLGGGFAGPREIGQPKGGLKGIADLSLFIR